MNDEQPARRGLITVGLLMAVVMSLLDTTVVNVSLPHMQGSLSASPEQITWVITSYIVAGAVMTPISGWLAARLGLKPMLILAVAGFTVASMLCGIAANMHQIVLFRMLQGAMEAPIAPLAQAVLFNINPPKKYGQAMALFMMGTVVAPVAGPIVGGYLTDALSWRWCFYINLPAGIGSMLLLWAFLPDETPKPRRFDFLGFGALALGIAAVQLLLDRGPTLDWFASREICIEAILALCGFWVFLTHTVTAEHPLFDLALARDRNLVSTTIFSFFLNTLMYSSLALLPLMMQGIMGYPVMLSGLVSAPRGCVMLVTLMVVGRLDAIVDRRLLVAVGLFVNIAAVWLMSRFDLSMATRDIVWASLVQGVGQGIIFVPLTTLAFVTVDPALRPDAAAFSGLLRNLGGSIGVAVMQALSAFNAQSMHASLAEHVTATNQVLRAALPPGLSPDTVEGALALNAEITRQATMVAYVDDFRLMVVLGLLCAPLIFVLRLPAASTGASEQREAQESAVGRRAR